MHDPRRTRISAPAIPLRGNDIDTDRIIPARFLKCVVFDGLGAHVFADDRAQARAEGRLHPFDDPRFAEARLLLVNRNFGCGSSREHAPAALMRWGHGIQAIVGESFADIFFGNCLANGIPCATASPDDVARLMALAESRPAACFTLDLHTLRLTAGDDLEIAVDIPDGPRQQLLEGRWDSTAELLTDPAAIAAASTRLPYFAGWR